MSDDIDIGHDPIISTASNIARADLSDEGRLIVLYSRRMDMGGRIRGARKDAGLSQTDLAKRLGLPQSVISDWENGKLMSWQDYGDRLATILAKPKDYFAAPSAKLEPITGIPVLGEVQAGVFRFALEVPPEGRAIIPVTSIRGYRGVQQAALRVVGPSMDLLYPDGSFVVVIPAAETDVREGDKVVVYRTQGELRETTIKELRLDGDRIALWPRSTHPDHQEPIYLDDGDQDGPEIAFVVIGSWRPEDRPPAPQPISLAKRA